MRIIVADDHSLFRDGIVSLLEAAGMEVIDQVGDGCRAVEAALRHKPEVVLLDVSMPVLGGLDALKQIKTQLPSTKIVMLTVSDSDKHLTEAVRAGADGYLLKNLDAEQFLELLRGLAHGEAAMTRSTTARLLQSFSQKPIEEPSMVDCLTRREIELLGYVARGLANKAIAEALSISENTVKYHMKNILQKLNVQNRTEAVAHAYGAGLLDPDQIAEKPGS